MYSDCKRIVFVAGGVSGGGAERVVCELSNYFITLKYHVTIITTSDDKASYILDSGIERVMLIQKSERRNFIYNCLIRLKRLKNYIKKNPYSNYVGFLPITTLMLLLYRKLIKGNVVISERSDPQRYNWLIQKLLYKYTSKADFAVFQTENVKKIYEMKNPSINGIVIPNSVKVGIQNKMSIINREKKIVSVGRLETVKNQAVLIRAFSIIAKEFSEFTLHFYGDGEQKDNLIQLTKNLFLSDRVYFHNFSKNIYNEICNSAIFVLSSNHEGMPNSLMEAMAIGITCIATNCPSGGVASLIHDGINGVLVPVDDEIALANAMRFVISNPNKANELAKEAMKIVDYYSPEIINKQWLGVILN